MQKIIMSILLLIMARMPITANAVTVFINDTQYGPSEGGTISVLHNDGQLQCFSVTDPAVADPTATPTVPATFVFLEAGDIKDVVMSDVLCRNISPVTLTL